MIVSSIDQATSFNNKFALPSLSKAKVLLSQFKGIYVVGMDPLAKLCAQRLEETFGIAVQKITPHSNSYKDEYCCSFFKGVAQSLIISANNVFLFPKDCVSSNTIINYHQALLPWHRGLNATMWAIWAGDSKAGLSWHKVDADIDTGGLLVQREVAIADSSNSSALMVTSIPRLKARACPY